MARFYPNSGGVSTPSATPQAQRYDLVPYLPHANQSGIGCWSEHSDQWEAECFRPTLRGQCQNAPFGFSTL